MPSERDLYSGVMQLANLLTRRLAPVFEKAKITPQQWAVLSVVGESEDAIGLAAIARKLMVSKQNMTGMVARLEDLGLVERGEDPNDLRSQRVVLTRRGRGVVDKLRPAYAEFLAAVDEGGLARAIDRLIEDLDRAG
jgi:DNA-binding MarR family transcriptional regulator